MKFDLNGWLRHLRRKYPLPWAVASTLGHIVRAWARTWIPIILCFAVFESILEPIFLSDSRMIPHWLPMILILPVMAVMIWQDRRFEYEVMRARRGLESPSILHDIGVMFGSVIYWSTIVITAVTMSSKTTYLTDVFVNWMPELDLATQTLYAAVLPTALTLIVESAAYLISMRIWYRVIPADEEPVEPEFPTPFQMFLRGMVWLIVLIMLPLGGWVIVTTGMVLVLLLVNYWKIALIVIPSAIVAVILFRIWRAVRIRHRCVKRLTREMDEARIRYQLEPHPIRSALFGGEDISLRIFIGDEVMLVRMIPFYRRTGTLIITPDGNIGQLHRVALGRPVVVSRFGEGTTKYQEYDPSGKNAKNNSLTEWITKRDTVFEDPTYPHAEKIYLVSPTPKFWVAGDLKSTATLDNGSRAYGYTLWTTTAFCRHLRMKQEDVMSGRQ